MLLMSLKSYNACYIKKKEKFCIVYRVDNLYNGFYKTGFNK